MAIKELFQRLRRPRASRPDIWKSVPLSSRLYFYAGVFTLFASIGFISLLMERVQLVPSRILLTVLIMGGFAILYAMVAIHRKFWLIPVFAVLEGFVFGVLKSQYPGSTVLVSGGSPLASQLMMLGLWAIAAVVAGYVLFIVFFAQQGARFFRAQNEIAMASEIHRTLVPAIHKTVGKFEMYGASVPSGEVGGDLVDVAGDDKSWTGYVADVSGHGVAAGVLMAMFKTAVRTSAVQGSPDLVLNDVHRALYPLKTPNMFVTAGFLQCRDGNELSLSLAGHPAMLHFCKRTGEVAEHPTMDLPLGILPEQTFGSVKITCEAGDLMVLLTDGMTEVFGKKGEELGVEPIKAALRNAAARPLPEIFESLRNVALGAGNQDDDQTMLLIRCAG